MAEDAVFRGKIGRQMEMAETVSGEDEMGEGLFCIGCEVYLWMA